MPDVDSHRPTIVDSQSLAAYVRSIRPDLANAEGPPIPPSSHGYVAILGDEVFKSPNGHADLESFRREARIQEFLNARMTAMGYLVPSITVMGVDRNPRILGMQRAQGQITTNELVASLPPVQQDQLAKDIGQFMREAHTALSPVDIKSMNLENNSNLAPPEAHSPTVESLALSLNDPRVQALLGPDLLARARHVERNYPAYLQKPQTLVFTHGDLNPYNLLFNQETGRLNGVIDYGLAGLNTAEHDFARLGDRPRAFLQAVATHYENSGGGPVNIDRVQTLRSAQLLNALQIAVGNERDKGYQSRIASELDRLLPEVPKDVPQPKASPLDADDKGKFGLKRTNEMLDQQFKELETDIPKLVAGTKPIGFGTFGFVVDHHDETATKIFRRHNIPEDQAKAEKVYNNELQVSRLLNGRAFGDAKTPVMFDATRLPDSDLAFASYRMEKLRGQEMRWHEFINTASHSELEDHFRSVGSVLAHFHSETGSLLNSVLPPQKGGWGIAIPSIMGLDEKRQEALFMANKYLQEHMQSGVVHGDFHTYNFLIDSKNNVTGLLDFSFTGRGKNQLADFAMIPDEGLSYAVAGYERQSGKAIDPILLNMTKLSNDATIINLYRKNPDINPMIADQARSALVRLDARLNAISHTTGISLEPEPTENRTASTTVKQPQQQALHQTTDAQRTQQDRWQTEQRQRQKLVLDPVYGVAQPQQQQQFQNAATADQLEVQRVQLQQKKPAPSTPTPAPVQPTAATVTSPPNVSPAPPAVIQANGTTPAPSESTVPLTANTAPSPPNTANEVPTTNPVPPSSSTKEMPKTPAINSGGSSGAWQAKLEGLNGKIGTAAMAINLADAAIKGDATKAAEVAGTAGVLHLGMKGVALVAGAKAIPVVGQVVGAAFAGKDSYDSAMSGNTTRAVISGSEATLYTVAAGAGMMAATNFWNPLGWAAAPVAAVAGGTAVTITAAKSVYDNWNTVKGWLGYRGSTTATPQVEPQAPRNEKKPPDLIAAITPTNGRGALRIVTVDALSQPREKTDVAPNPPSAATVPPSPSKLQVTAHVRFEI